MSQNDLIKYEAGLIKRVNDVVNITSKLLLANSGALKILHLDDHLLFSKGISNCIYKTFPSAIIKWIQDGDKALEYVSYCLANKGLLDLIITDINHPGVNGIDFSNAVRGMETNHKQKIPILFMTMMDDISIIQKIEKIPFTIYLQKTDKCEKINSAINNLI